MNETPPTVEVRTRARVFAVSTDPRLRNAGGINGDLDRDSMARNDASTSTDRPSRTIVSSVLKPEDAAVVSPKTRRIVPRDTVIAPGTSRRRFLSQPAVYRRNIW